MADDFENDVPSLTVKQLMELLATMPPDAHVTVRDFNGSEHATKVQLLTNGNVFISCYHKTLE